jgi:hypothetical protein
MLASGEQRMGSPRSSKPDMADVQPNQTDREEVYPNKPGLIGPPNHKKTPFTPSCLHLSTYFSTHLHDPYQSYDGGYDSTFPQHCIDGTFEA